jgi:transposase
LLAEERARKRAELLAATEEELEKIAAATRRPKRALRGKDKIGVRVGKIINKYKMGKHFILEIEDNQFTYSRDEAKIQEESALDGIYVVRTSADVQTLSPDGTVRAYKDLAKVERAFRSIKTIDLKVRPIYHWLDNRIRAHVFLCMLAYYVEWHMRQRLAPILFDDEQKEEAEQARRSVVAPAQRSDAARHKETTKRTADGYPVHSFRTLLEDLATLAKNRVCLTAGENAEFYQLTDATPPQQHAFDLLGVKLKV